MGSTAIYLIGAPGIGKSTVMELLVNALTPGIGVVSNKPIAHVRYPGEGWVQLGKPRDGFPGTDTLGHAAINFAVPWISSDDRPANLLGEGDRLAIDRFMRVLDENYDRLLLFHLSASPGVPYQRMLDRAERLGRAPQNESWWRGRATKAANLAARWSAVELDATLPPGEIAGSILARVDP